MATQKLMKNFQTSKLSKKRNGIEPRFGLKPMQLFKFGLVSSPSPVEFGPSPARVSSSRLGSRQLALRSGAIIAGVEYTVRLSVARGDLTGWSEMVVLGNLPPSGGILMVSPSSGVQLTTTFEFQQKGWCARN